MQEKIKIHFTDQDISSYNINLTIAFLNWPIKTYILKIWWSAMWHVQLYNTQPCLHTLMQTHHLANQSARTILVIL